MVCHHQPQTLPGKLFNDLFLGLGRLGLEVLQDFYEFTVPSVWHGQNEFKGLATGQGDLAQLVDVVQRQQAPIGHNNQALDVTCRILRCRF